MQLQVDQFDSLPRAAIRSLTWGVIWRVVAFLAASGAVLGVIYGVLYFSLVAFRSPDGEPTAQGSFFALIVGAFLGIQIGMLVGLILGLLQGLLFGGIVYYLLRRGRLPALYPRQFLIAALASSIALNLLVLLPMALGLQAADFTTWLRNGGAAYILAGFTVVIVTAGVARWAINHTRAAPPS
jgi:hypothetical protein